MTSPEPGAFGGGGTRVAAALSRAGARLDTEELLKELEVDLSSVEGGGVFLARGD